jgi:mono/diheme cytochrome c family protein
MRQPVDVEERELARRACALAAVLLVTGVVLTASRIALAQEAAATAAASGESGEATFKTYCGSCHGKSAKGDGPLAEALRYRPADLTTIAKRSGGRFDAEKVHRIIDGRDFVKGHGGTDMPVWGDAFKHSGEGFDEKAVKERIQAIVDYLSSVQVK